MESFEAIIESEWSSLNAMFFTEESGFMARLLDYCSIPNDLHLGSNHTIPSNNTNVDHVSLGTNCFQPTSNHDSYCAGDFNYILETSDDFVFFNEEAEENKSLVQLFCNADTPENMTMQLEQEVQVPDPELHQDSEFRNPVQKSKKRSTNLVDVRKNKRNVKTKMNQKLTMASCTNNKKQNAANQKESSSSCSSESDSIASHEVNGVASNSSDSKVAKTVNSNEQLRAVRGSATDPQSLYARKRRERINKRLRTLQNLVPNGTKVVISTMLEDAVQYVKFLQTPNQTFEL